MTRNESSGEPSDSKTPSPKKRGKSVPVVSLEKKETKLSKEVDVATPSLSEETVMAPENKGSSKASTLIGRTQDDVEVISSYIAVSPVATRSILKSNETTESALSDTKETEEKLRSCLEALKDDTQCSTYETSGKTHFSMNLRTVTTFLREVVQSNGAQGDAKGSPASLFVYGPPGIGKSTGILWCCDLVAHATDLPKEANQPRFCHIYAADLVDNSDAENFILSKIFTALGERKSARTKDFSLSIKRVLKDSNKTLVIVFEKVESLLSKGEFAVAEEFLKPLHKLAADESVPLALIEISNEKVNRRLSKVAKVRRVAPCSLMMEFD
jgi:hypothetical protein